MKRWFSFFLLSTFVLLTLNSCKKNPIPPPIPEPIVSETTFKAEFRATPSKFSAQGGVGIVEGILKEFSPEGKSLHERPLASTEFTISLKSGDATQIIIDDAKKEFVLTQGEEEVVFVILAQTNDDKQLCQELTIVREKGEAPIPSIKLPLEYVAEYNVGKTAGTFATSYLNDEAGYFSFEEIDEVCPVGYHTPSRQEAAVIMPLYGPQYEIYLMFDSNVAFDNVSEAIQVGTRKATYLSDYKSVKGAPLCYALRFKKATEEIEEGYPAAEDNKLMCAYRYEVVGTHVEGNKESHLKVTARLLGETFTGTIDDICNEGFWEKNNETDVIRIIPSSVYFHPQKQIEIFGAGAFLWTATEHEQEQDFVWTIAYISKMAYISYNSKLFKFGIRPMEDFQ